MSLVAQQDQDYERIRLEDPEGRGVGYANRRLVEAKVRGDYVMVLDDDDLLLHNNAIGLMKKATQENPDLLIFKADHGPLGILPSPLVWGKRPIQGRIGSIDFITRNDVWLKHISAFGVDEAGDYAFLRAIWETKPSVIWLDEVLAGVQRISRGAPEW